MSSVCAIAPQGEAFAYTCIITRFVCCSLPRWLCNVDIVVLSRRSFDSFKECCLITLYKHWEMLIGSFLHINYKTYIELLKDSML